MVSILEELEGLFPAAAAESVYEVRLDLISPDPGQPRKEIDSAALDELALSIEANGMLSPILLRPDPESPGRYVIVTGERRVLAAERARRTSIPALIREVPPDLLPILQLVENVQRADLRPLETARALASLLASTPDLTQTRAAALLGKSKAWISQHLALLDYDGPTQEALHEDLLQSPETARRFDQLPSQDKQVLLDKARDQASPISRNAVAAAHPVAASPTTLPKATGRPPKQKTIPLPPVTAAQLAVLFEALGLTPVPGTQPEIWQLFLSRLNP